MATIGWVKKNARYEEILTSIIHIFFSPEVAKQIGNFLEEEEDEDEDIEG